MVLQALLTFPDEFRQCSGVWYIDNIASLMSLLKGRSDNEDLDHMAQTALSSTLLTVVRMGSKQIQLE